MQLKDKFILTQKYWNPCKNDFITDFHDVFEDALPVGSLLKISYKAIQFPNTKANILEKLVK